MARIVKRRRWQPDEIAIVKAAWEDDAIESPVEYVLKRVHRSPKAIEQFAYARGFATQRSARQNAQRLGLPYSPPVAAEVRTPARPRIQRTPEPGYGRIPCDAGDRELIRRRLVHTINALAGELGRDPKSVAAAVARVSASGFKREHPYFPIAADDIAPGASVMTNSLKGALS